MTNRFLSQKRLNDQARRVARIVSPERPSLSMEAVREDVCAAHAASQYRDPMTFKPRKTDDRGSVTLALAKHVYGRFKTPYHLERIWYSRCRADPVPGNDRVGNDRVSNVEVLPTPERDRRIAWYVCAASGGSLHKQHCKDFFTKKETHAFLTAPGRLSFVEALWYAVSSSYTDDHGLRLRVMRSKVARTRVSVFWKEAARFFIEHETPIGQINDLVDFFENRLVIDPTYSLRGRTPQSLARAQADWHRTLSRVKHHGGGSWEGVEIPDYVPNSHIEPTLPPLERQIELVHKIRSSDRLMIRQLRTGDALAEEGSAMRHCVYSYKDKCERGYASIWSMTRFDKRLLTIEMNNDGVLVQIRGFGNRAATSEEMRAIGEWARLYGLTVPARGW